jgi:predicted protein tyrosine phosphatase
MLRNDGFDPSHRNACGAGSEEAYRGLKVRVMSAAKANRYTPGDDEVAISIQGTAERPAALSRKFRDILSLVFDDTCEFADYTIHGHDNPTSITSEQADAVAAFVNQHRDAHALLIHCAAGISRSRSILSAICNALDLPYTWTVVNHDVYRQVTDAFNRVASHQ